MCCLLLRNKGLSLIDDKKTLHDGINRIGYLRVFLNRCIIQTVPLFLKNGDYTEFSGCLKALPVRGIFAYGTARNDTVSISGCLKNITHCFIETPAKPKLKQNDNAP